MEFYALLFLLIVFLYFISCRYKVSEKIITSIIFALFVLIGGFRDKVGCDYISYTNWYIKGTRDDNFEFGFLAIMKTLRFLNLDYKFLFFFFSFFTYLFVYLAAKKYNKEASLSLVLYFLIPVLFLCSFIYIRQSLSVAIAFYAFTFLLEKKYFIYFSLMIVGISFHYSCSIPFVIFFMIYKWGYSIKNSHLIISMIITFVISRIGIIDLVSLFLKNSHYLYYVSNKAIPVPLLKLAAINIMGVILVSYFNKKGFKYDYQKFLLILYICSILFLNIFSESGELTRIYIYFRIFEIVLVTDVIRYAFHNKRFVLISFICLFYIFPFFRAIKIDSESSFKDEFKLAPYRSLLLE